MQCRRKMAEAFVWTGNVPPPAELPPWFVVAALHGRICKIGDSLQVQLKFGDTSPRNAPPESVIVMEADGSFCVYSLDQFRSLYEIFSDVAYAA